MPKPEKDETENEFVQRCIPIVIKEGTAENPDQAAAICHSMWREHKKEKSSEAKEMKGMSWFEIKNKAENSEVWIYDEIGAWGIKAMDFIKELKGIKNKTIDMHINCPGGDVFDGAAIYNAIKNHGATFTTYIDGLAASIASVIALAGDKVVMAENAIYMMHNPWGLVIGNADDMRKQAEVLDKVRDTMLGAYITKSGQSQEDIIALLDNETWLNADEAKKAGFVDEISGKMDIAACARFVPVMAKLGFKKIPKALNPNQTPSARDIEKALRDVGCSKTQAKVILAKGYSDDLRDVDCMDAPLVTETRRDVEPRKPITNDRTAELLIKADFISQ